jgi:hypothetical protein
MSPATQYNKPEAMMLQLIKASMHHFDDMHDAESNEMADDDGLF